MFGLSLKSSTKRKGGPVGIRTPKQKKKVLSLNPVKTENTKSFRSMASSKQKQISLGMQVLQVRQMMGSHEAV